VLLLLLSRKNATACPRERHGHAAFASTWKVRLAAAAVQRNGWLCEVVAMARVSKWYKCKGLSRIQLSLTYSQPSPPWGGKIQHYL